MEEKAEKRPICPKCGKEERQMKSGFTKAGSQKWLCYVCKCRYTPNPKKWKYSEEEKELALKMLTMSMSGRGVGKVLKMSKANAYRWAREAALKKTENLEK